MLDHHARLLSADCLFVLVMCIEHLSGCLFVQLVCIIVPSSQTLRAVTLMITLAFTKVLPGQPVFTDVYLWGGKPLISLAQAFYKCNDTTPPANYGAEIGGVVLIDTSFDQMSLLLKQQLPTADSESAICQNFGEILASSDSDVSGKGSEGLSTRLNITHSNMEALSQWAQRNLGEFGGFVPSQNHTNVDSDFIASSLPTMTYDTIYDFLSIELGKWTLMTVTNVDCSYLPHLLCVANRSRVREIQSPSSVCMLLFAGVSEGPILWRAGRRHRVLVCSS